MGVEMLPDGAKRVRRKPTRLVDEEGSMTSPHSSCQEESTELAAAAGVEPGKSSILE